MASNAIDNRTRKYCVFNRSSAVFSGKNCNIIYPILKYNTKYMYMFFSTDFAGFREILLIAQSCVIFG